MHTESSNLTNIYMYIESLSSNKKVYFGCVCVCFSIKKLKNTCCRKMASQQIELGKVNIHLSKNESRSLSLTLYKSQFEIEQSPQCQA